MDAARRQAYLSSLGIDVWVPRAAVQAWVDDAVDTAAAEPTLVDEYEDYAPVPPVAEVRNVASSPLPAAETQPALVDAPAAKVADSAAPRFALNFLHVPGAWLVCELADAEAQDFNNAEFGLLQNILKALRLPDQLGNRAAFHWPMKIGPHDHLRNFPQGENEAGATVMRTLNARLKREPEPIILVFGATAAHLLLLTQTFDTARGKWLNWPMQKAHLLITESLNAMLQDARRKKFVWRDLQACFSIPQD